MTTNDRRIAISRIAIMFEADDSPDATDDNIQRFVESRTSDPDMVAIANTADSTFKRIASAVRTEMRNRDIEAADFARLGF